MTPEELGQLIRGGENSSVEFKRETVANHDLAKELAAFLNLQGGTVLLGIDDDGRIVGAECGRLEDWVAELCRVKLEPQVLPSLAWARDAEPGSMYWLSVSPPVLTSLMPASTTTARPITFAPEGRLAKQAARHSNGCTRHPVVSTTD